MIRRYSRPRCFPPRLLPKKCSKHTPSTLREPAARPHRTVNNPRLDCLLDNGGRLSRSMWLSRHSARHFTFSTEPEQVCLTSPAVLLCCKQTNRRKVGPSDFRKDSQRAMSEAIVRLRRKGQMVIPRSLREAVGVSEGTLMKVAVVEGRQLLVTPQLIVDRSLVTDNRKGRKQAFRDLARVVAEIRQEAKEKAIDKMPKSEINRAVAKARRNLKTTKRPGK